jgi:hypothetical protein
MDSRRRRQTQRPKLTAFALHLLNVRYYRSRAAAELTH